MMQKLGSAIVGTFPDGQIMQPELQDLSNMLGD